MEWVNEWAEPAWRCDDKPPAVAAKEAGQANKGQGLPGSLHARAEGGICADLAEPGLMRFEQI